jgi:hypothetical protein
LVFVGALLVAQNALATPIYLSRIDLLTVAQDASGISVVHQTSTGNVQNTDSLALMSLGSVSGAAGSTARASISDGMLHAYATAAGGTPFTSFSAADGIAQAFYEDTVVFASDSLPAGSTIQARIGLDLHYSMTSDKAAPCNSGTSTRAIVTASLSWGSSDELQIQDSTCDDMDLSNSSGVFSFVLGQEYVFNSGLTANAGAYGGMSATADAGNTLRFFIVPAAGVSYTTASGNLYASSIPEPSTLFLVGAGVAALARRRRL